MRTFKAFNVRRNETDNLICVYGSTPRSAARGVALQAQIMRQRVGQIQVQEGDLDDGQFTFRIGPAGLGDRHWKVSPDNIDTLPDFAGQPVREGVALIN